MYSNEKNPGLNWKDLIIKAIFLVIFVLLIVWLFPKVPNMTAFYSNIFRENISYMQDAAESYYTIERLPKNVGDTAEMTLQEMIDKNLILPFVDKDGNACDTKASYVQITKNKTDYTLTVNLVCPTEKNKVNKILGCHDYCENCTEKVADIEYQFKKAVTANQTVYSCPNGGTLNGTTCTVSTEKSYTAYVRNGETNYSCPNGGALSGTTCYILDESTSTYKASSRTTSGSSYPATAKATSASYNATANTSSGSYNATWSSGSARTYAATKNTTPTTTYAAKATSGTQSMSGYYTSKPQGYTCDYGLAPTSCSTCSMYKSYYYNCKATKTTYSCPNGGSLDNTGKTCVVPGKTTYSCPNGGTLSGQTCVVSGVSSYTCPNGGYLSGTKCITSGTTTYTCPNGGTLSGTKCYVTGETKYTCPNGGYLSGTTCIVSGTSEYYCPNGGTLSGSMCYVTSNSTRTYAATKTTGSSSNYCDTSDTYKDGKCYYTETKTYTATKADNKTTYTCPSGGTLDGTTCKIYTSSSYNATGTTKLVTTYDYKWSKNETLDGYVKTGETRQIEA